MTRSGARGRSRRGAAAGPPRGHLATPRAAWPPPTALRLREREAGTSVPAGAASEAEVGSVYAEYVKRKLQPFAAGVSAEMVAADLEFWAEELQDGWAYAGEEMAEPE